VRVDDVDTGYSKERADDGTTNHPAGRSAREPRPCVPHHEHQTVTELSLREKPCGYEMKYRILRFNAPFSPIAVDPLRVHGYGGAQRVEVRLEMSRHRPDRVGRREGSVRLPAERVRREVGSVGLQQDQ